MPGPTYTRRSTNTRSLSIRWSMPLIGITLGSSSVEIRPKVSRTGKARPALRRGERCRIVSRGGAGEETDIDRSIIEGHVDGVVVLDRGDAIH